MRTIPIVFLALAAVACGPSEREIATIAERDNLLADVLEQATLINEINLELSTVSDSAIGLNLATEDGLNRAAEENAVTLERVRNLITRLETQEQALGEQRERIRSLASGETRLLTQIREFQSTVAGIREKAEEREAELAGVIEQQRSMIVALSDQLNTARDENVHLAESNEDLAVAMDELTAENNTVYYVVGTRNELKDRGIIVEEGSKFLFFGSRTIQPSRDLNPSDFTAIDKTQVFEIPLPRADRSYRIVTRQNPEYLVATRDDGKVRDVVAIAAPDGFWEASRFLILVES